MAQRKTDRSSATISKAEENLSAVKMALRDSVFRTSEMPARGSSLTYSDLGEVENQPTSQTDSQELTPFEAKFLNWSESRAVVQIAGFLSGSFWFSLGLLAASTAFAAYQVSTDRTEAGSALLLWIGAVFVVAAAGQLMSQANRLLSGNISPLDTDRLRSQLRRLVALENK